MGAVLSILPVVFVGYFSYKSSALQVQERVNQTEIQYVRQLNATIEQTLVTVDHTLTTFLDSNDMKEALVSPLRAVDFQLYNTLRSEITHLQSFDTKVEDLVLVNARQEWMIKNNGLKRFDRHDDRTLYETYFELPFDSNWVLLETAKFKDPILSQACPYAVGLVKKLPSVRTDKYGLAFANIPVCSLAQMIGVDQSEEEVLIVGEDGRIVVHRDMEMIGKALAAHPVFASANASFEDPSGQFAVSLDDRRYSVTYSKSFFNDWVYLSIVSVDALTRESRDIGWLTFSVCVFIISLSMLFMWLATRRLYRPVNRLIKSIEDDAMAASADEPRGELQMIESYITHLFSSKSRLEAELKDYSQQRRTLFLNRWFAGDARHVEIGEKLRSFGFEEQMRPWKRMTMLALQVDTMDNTRYEAKDVELLLFAVSNIAEEAVAEEHRLPTVWLDRTLIVLIGFEEAEEQVIERRLYELTESVQALVGRFLQLSISIGISLPFGRAVEAPKAVEEGFAALRHRMKLGMGVIVPYRDTLAQKPVVGYGYPDRLERELAESIQTADEEEALQALRQWNAEASTSSRSPDDYQISLMRLLNRLLLLKQESGIDLRPADVRKDSPYEEFLTLRTSEEIEPWFRERLVRPLLLAFRERRDSQYQNISEKIIDMIRSNYDVDFTLEDCAAKLHYNANYLSSVFKAETNSTFSEYLAQYRLQKAKEWLTETGMTVKDIAERLKYTNSHNFIRSFRKQEGMTPGQYRDRYGKA
ncbi:AraC family transcriptional regulator [Paenibacillus sp. TRM 82003]|nr:AraC family transcriptional regulator [Paenibacillus sp. TRM 82003]